VISMTESSAISTAVLDDEEIVSNDSSTVDTAAAISVIDEELVRLVQRELVSANEVTDVLLDIRRLIAG
jgi:hypothetical protein